jgi:hypothetical protein
MVKIDWGTLGEQSNIWHDTINSQVGSEVCASSQIGSTARVVAPMICPNRLYSQDAGLW